MPGKIVVLYGKNLGPPEPVRAQLTADGRLSANRGARVLINDSPAALIYVSSGQAAAIVPYSLDGERGAQLRVEHGGMRSEPVAFPVAAVAPALFTADFSGQGQVVALNEDGITVNSAGSPAGKGSVIVLYATGEGQTDPPGVDGKPASEPLPKPRKQVLAVVGAQPAQVLYAGGAPGLVAGVMQVNVKLPADIPSGNVPVQILVGGVGSQEGATVAVR